MRWNSLATRLSAAFAVVVFSTALIVAGFSLYQARAALSESLSTHGRMLLASLALHAADRLVNQDYITLHESAEQVARKAPLISYAMVVNEDGKIVAHTDHSFEGQPWTSQGAADKGGEVRERVVSYRGVRVLEIRTPVVVVGREAGMVQVGVNFGEVAAITRKLTLTIAAACLLVFAGAVAGVRMITARMTGELARVVETSREIAAGNLQIRVPEEGIDEFVALAQAFNGMAENLRTAIRQVQGTGVRVGEFSSAISAMIQEQATSSSEQAASVSEVTATVEELSRTSRQIAANAEAVKDAAGRTMETAQSGTAIVREGVAAMDEIRERVGDIAHKTLFLGEKSHEIGKVMDIIKEIAGEIHLLALNAAIESATAGEHGRRFAVVASEVRRLAHKARESTETIRSIVSEILAATKVSIEATEQGQRDVDRWRAAISRSADSFEEIIRMIEQTSEASAQISLATHQQTSANEQVVQAMHQIAEMVRLTATNMKESAASAAELKGLVGSLREMASVFRV